MESPNSKGKNQAMVDDDLPGETSENNSTREMSLSPKPDNQQLNSSDSMETSPPMESKPLEDLAMEQVDDQEYVCKYCNKKFYNKQALGGHQNAHKAERALEKSVRERARAGPGYLGTDFYTYPNMNTSQYYPNSFTRYPDHLNLQPMPNRYHPYSIPPPPPYPNTMMPMAQDPYAPRLLPGPNNNNNNYHAAGWPRPIMATRPPMGMQNPGGHAWFPSPPQGNGGTISGGGAVIGISAGPSSSSGLVNNADNNNQQAEEPELDLTLKL